MAEQGNSGETVRTRLSDSDRVEAFSDGVLAIAITLLIFNLQTPDFESGELLDGLLRQWPTYIAYLASFLYLAVIWLNHDALFSRVRYVDLGVRWANIGVLLTSATLPFPTAVLSTALQAADGADQRTAIGLYALVAALMCLAWMVLWNYLRTHPRLLEPGVAPEFFRGEQLRAGTGIALYTAGGVLGCVINPLIALAVFLALPPFYAATSEGLSESRLFSQRRPTVADRGKERT